MATRKNSTMGQDDDEVAESTDMAHNKKVMRGHAEDSRFDEGSTDHELKIVRPASHMSPKFSGYMGKSGRAINVNAGHIKSSTPANSKYQPGKIGGGK